MRSVDVRRLAREGLLFDGASFGWEWKDEQGQRTANIEVRVQGDGVRFLYRLNDRHEVDDLAPLTSTECNYGGVRHWFACPCCGARCAVLYLGERVACRKCYRLKYPSQSGDEVEASWRKQRKLEAQLGGANYWRKPKGMHQTTFERIRREIIEQESRRTRLLVAKYRRMFGDRYF